MNQKTKKAVEVIWLVIGILLLMWLVYFYVQMSSMGAGIVGWIIFFSLGVYMLAVYMIITIIIILIMLLIKILRKRNGEKK